MMKPYMDIMRLVWPLALGMINSAVMQFVDRAYLSRFSIESLEAVLPAGMLAWIFMGFFQSVIGYSGVFVAQYHGAMAEDRCRSCCVTANWLALAAGLLMIPFVPFGNLVLSATAPSASLYSLERTYYDIVCLGGICIYGQMAASSYFTGRGRTRIVFWVNLVGNLVNVAMDPFLIFGWCGLPRLGIAGAAYATVASMALQWAVLGLVSAHELGWRWRPSAAIAWKILRYGVPSGLYEVLNLASFTVFVFVTGGVGEMELAVSNACFTVNYLLFAPMMGFSIGAQTLVGQARGKGDNRAASLAFRRTLVIALALVAVSCIITLAFHRQIFSLFASGVVPECRTEFHDLGFKLLVIMAAWQMFDAADVVVCGALKGAGDTKFVMWWMCICAFAIWMPMVFAVRAFANTMPALWLTMIAYVFITCVGTFIRWYNGKWKGIRLV